LQPDAKDGHVYGYSVVEELEKRFAVEIGNERFIPFLTLFEFEALVFSSPMEIANHFESPKLESAIQKHR